jgi:hypothetical protein
MYTKAKIYNLALGALLLTKKVINVDTDTSTEVQTLNTHYDTAFRAALEDMDLDATASEKKLELITTCPNDLWCFAYKYPTNCSFLRRIKSSVVKDNRTTKVPLRVINHEGVKAIYTNECAACVEFVSNDLPLSILSASAGLAIAYKLAALSSSLITGKGSVALAKDITAKYLLAKAEAQEHDRLENANFDDDVVMSEFVEARLE